MFGLLEIANQVVQRCMGLVNALYGLDQSGCTMNIIICYSTQVVQKGFPGTSRVVHQTNQVMHTTLKRPSENTEAQATKKKLPDK